MKISINKKEYTMDELAAKLGIDEVKQISIFKEVRDGTLEASVVCEDSPFPGVDLDLHLKDKESLPVKIVRVEQPIWENKSVRAFIYGRADSYIAYMDIDTRPDAEEEADPLPASIILSGDLDSFVEAYAENMFVCYRGQLPETSV